MIKTGKKKVEAAKETVAASIPPEIEIKSIVESDTPMLETK